MTAPDFTTTILVDQSPTVAFNAITDPRKWWSEQITGETVKLDDVFDYHFEDVHTCRMRLTEVVPDKKVTWHVLENYFKFTEDKSEWVGTNITFELSEREGKTQLVFTHHGLVPEYECFDICRNAWTQYIQHSLYNLIATGKGEPNGKDKPTTEDERKLTAIK